MIIVVTNKANTLLKDEIDPVMWTNIAHALATEKQSSWNKPATAPENILSDTELAAMTSLPTVKKNEHLWIIGHGMPGKFEHRSDKGINALIMCALQKTSGNMPTSITITSCHGALGAAYKDTDSGAYEEIEYSMLTQLNTHLSENGANGISTTAFLGRVISAPVLDPKTNQLMPSRVIRPDSMIEDRAAQLLDTLGWTKTKTEIERLISDASWGTISNNAQRAEIVAQKTGAIYSKWIAECDSPANNFLFKDDSAIRQLTSHNLSAAQHLSANNAAFEGFISKYVDKNIVTQYETVNMNPMSASSSSSSSGSSSSTSSSASSASSSSSSSSTTASVTSASGPSSPTAP